jgi:hypothetical protein
MLFIYRLLVCIFAVQLHVIQSLQCTTICNFQHSFQSHHQLGLASNSPHIENTDINSGSDKHMVRYPHHVAVVVDGNGRWAQSRNLTRSQGHRIGTVR